VTVAATAAGADFWSALPPADRAALQSAGVTRRFERGSALMHQGQMAEAVVIVRSGQLKIYSSTANGHQVLLAIRGPGDILGELSAIDGQPRSASVVALEDVEVLAVAPSAFRTFLADHPAAAMALLGMLTRRLRDADLKRAGFSEQRALGRVAARLLELVDRFGVTDADGVHSITLRLSQEELASWSGCGQKSVDRALATMRELRWIETSRRQFRVLDLDALRRAAT
jgi:CRP/FNR family cyclic AMP-dependent transcriptional regulator